MKLAVSNIAWDDVEQSAILAQLPALGVAGVEIAPTKLWPDWLGADPVAAASAIVFPVNRQPDTDDQKQNVDYVRDVDHSV